MSSSGAMCADQHLMRDDAFLPCPAGVRHGHGVTGGAGGNRTPVHQAMSVRDTTIPDFETDAISPTGRMFSIARKPRHVFACGQRTFSRSAFFLAVIPRFCCRAAVDRPRAPLLVTMSLYNLRIRRQERIAGWQFCFCPV